MPRQYTFDISVQPPREATRVWREYGDGGAGLVHQARIEGYDAGNLVYREISVNASGELVVAGGGGGGGTQYTEGDVDVSVTGTALMWEDAADTLRVTSAAKPLPVNIISGAGSGGTAAADDSVFTPATTNVTPIGGFADDTAPDSVDEGDTGAVRMSLRRELYVQVRDAQGNERGLRIDANGALAITAAALPLPTGAATAANQSTIIGHVDGIEALLATIDADTGVIAGAVAGTEMQVDIVSAPTITVDSELPAAVALAENLGNPTTPLVGAAQLGFDGATWDRMRAGSGDGAGATGMQNVLPMVFNGATHDRIPGSATDGVTVNLGANNDVIGPVAHDGGAGAVNPLLIGGYASEDEPTAVSADADAVRAWFDRTGRQVVLLGHADPEPPLSVNLTADGTVIGAPGASLSLYIRKGSIHNRSAAAQTVALEDGSGGTERWVAELAADGGGSIFDFGDRGWKLTANTLLALDCKAGASPDIDVNVTDYYIAA